MSDTTNVRVRFAPSPTGTLHLGSARSALYNWLFARHHGGTYVLRVEDTDQARSTPEHVQQALRVFRWLGLTWDEGPDVDGPYGPYFQSQRDDAYDGALAQLLGTDRAAGHGFAYRCFCTKEELDAERAAAEAAKRPYVYSGRCRGLDPAEAEQRASSGDTFVVRFAVPREGETVVADLVLGDTRFENALISDFVIARADGSPLYNFANVVDDAAMRITHVIRGQEHLVNTPPQMLLYRALGHDVPAFAHLPLILGPDGSKLSKRKHHSSHVEQFAAQGYAPDAVLNGLALVGWSKDDVTNVMSVDELVEAFDVSRVKKSPAAIDYDKLSWINGEHLRAMTPDAWATGYEAWRADWLPADDDRSSAAHAMSGIEAAALVQEKVTTWGEVPGYLAFMLEPFEMTEQAEEKLLKTGEVGLRVLGHVIDALDTLESFELEPLEAALRGSCEQLDLKAGKVFAPIRLAATGRPVAPGLWESLHALGRERSLERLRAGRDRLAAALQPSR